MVRTFHVCTVLTLSELCPQIAKRNQGLYPEFWASSCFIIALPQHVAKDRNQGACQTIALCTSWSCVCPVQLPSVSLQLMLQIPSPAPHATHCLETEIPSPLPCCWGLSWQALIDLPPSPLFTHSTALPMARISIPPKDFPKNSPLPLQGLQSIPSFGTSPLPSE